MKAVNSYLLFNYSFRFKKRANLVVFENDKRGLCGEGSNIAPRTANIPQGFPT